MNLRAEVAVATQDGHGEGVFWSAEHGLLFWTDMHRERVWTFAPARNEARPWPTPIRVSAFAARRGRPWNELVVAHPRGFAFLDLLSGALEEIGPADAEADGLRLNDGRTDRQGRFLVAGMDEKTFKPRASVWRLDPDRAITRLFDGVTVGNGACFSPDGGVYWFADSAKGAIEAFDYDAATGTPSRRRVVAVTAAPGVPDGSCVDAEGFVWNAVWEGYRVVRYAPDGRVDRIIETPVAKPSCCAFGGEDLATLYITSSRAGETAADLAARPLSGHLFAVRPGVKGLVDAPFAG